MKKKLLSTLLAAAMVLSLLPAVAFAAEPETLQAEIDNAVSGSTVKLTADTTESITIPAGKEITLDLAGFTLTNTADQDTITNNGTLTITGDGTVDNVSHGKGAVRNAGTATLDAANYTRSHEAGSAENANGGNSWYTVYNTGTMTINSGANISQDGTDNGGCAGKYSSLVENVNKTAGGKATMTINGGTFTNGINVVKNDDRGEMTINGGTFNGAVMNWHHMNIVGGTFNSATEKPLLINGSYRDDIDAGVLTVSGGTFAAQNLFGVGKDKTPDYGTITVSGGNFTYTALNLPDKGTTAASLGITGGTFSSDVSEYVPDGFVQNGNTVEELGETNAVAKIGTTYYATLLDAYAAIPRNDTSKVTTIEVLKDCEGGSFGSDSDKGMNYVIDFGGNTYTAGPAFEGSTGYKNQCIRVLKGSTAVFKNGTVKAAADTGIIQVMHTYGNVTLQDFTVDATAATKADAYEADCGTLNILGNSSILASNGNVGLYVAFWPRGGYTDGTAVTIDTTGEITGKLTYEWDDHATVDQQQVENKAVLNIKNGYFNFSSIEALFTSSIPADLKVPKITISGGYFTSDPSDYLETNPQHYVVESTEPGYLYTVSKEKPETVPVTVSENVDATVDGITDTEAVTAIESVLGKSEVDGVADAAKGSKNDILADANVEVPDTATRVEVEIEVAVKATGAELSGTAAYVNYNVTPTAIIKIDGKQEGTLETVPNHYLNGNITVKLPIPNPETFTPKEILHTSAGYATERFLNADTYSTAAKKFTIENGCAVLTITHFSDLRMNGIATFAAKIGYTPYDTFQDALNAATNGQTIEVVNGTEFSGSMGGSSSKIIHVKNSTANSSVDVTVNSETKAIAKDNTADFTYTYVPTGGGTYVPTYTTTVEKPEHGTVTVSPKNASKGQTVTITVTPDKGYELDWLFVTDKNGDELALTDKGNGKFTFKMPASKVSIEAWFTETAPVVVENPYVDVFESDYYYNEVLYAYENGLMVGNGDTFAPKASFDRKQLAMLLWNMEGKPVVNYAMSFNDVPAGQWYTEAIRWAASTGVMTGYGADTFGTDDLLTRQQMATAFFRYAEAKAEKGDLNDFTDGAQVADWAADGMVWAVNHGLFQGYNNCLTPGATANRAQVAIILYRYCENIA